MRFYNVVAQSTLDRFKHPVTGSPVSSFDTTRRPSRYTDVRYHIRQDDGSLKLK